MFESVSCVSVFASFVSDVSEKCIIGCSWRANLSDVPTQAYLTDAAHRITLLLKCSSRVQSWLKLLCRRCDTEADFLGR